MTTAVQQFSPPLVVDQQPPPFEGVEKRLIVQVNPVLCNPYAMSQLEWQSILDKTHCEIVSVKQLNDHRVYLLSESTLTVWPTGFLLKTCGRTTPLLGLKAFLDAFELNAQETIQYFVYSRLDFLHPKYQIWPHRNFSEEIQFVKSHLLFHSAKHCEIKRNGQTFHAIFATSDRNLARYEIKSDITGYHSEEILMTKIPTDCVKTFTGISEQTAASENQTAASKEQSASGQSNKSAITRFIDTCSTESIASNNKAVLDEFWFQPCGYSANALLDRSSGTEKKTSYFSCHVSPEPATSYASIEVGWRFSGGTVDKLPSLSFSDIQVGYNEGFHMKEMMDAFNPENAFLTEVTVTEHLTEMTCPLKISGEEPDISFCSKGIQCTIRFARITSAKTTDNEPDELQTTRLMDFSRFLPETQPSAEAAATPAFLSVSSGYANIIWKDELRVVSG